MEVNYSTPALAREAVASNGERQQVRYLMPGFHHSVAALPLPLAVALTLPLPLCLIGSSALMIGWPAIRNNGKIELDHISTEERLRQLFARYGCNETEFSYVIFKEQRNFTTIERETATEERQRNGGNRALLITGHAHEMDDRVMTISATLILSQENRQIISFTLTGIYYGIVSIEFPLIVICVP